MAKLLCCKRIFNRDKAKLAEIQPKNHQNVKKTHFSQKVPGVNGLKEKRKGTKGVKRCRKLFVPRNLKMSIKNRELVEKTQT